MEGVASRNVRFRPCVACRVCNMYKLSCELYMVLYKQNFVVNFVGRCYYKYGNIDD